MGSTFTKASSRKNTVEAAASKKMVFFGTYDGGLHLILAQLGASSETSTLPLRKFDLDGVTVHAMIEENWDFGGRMPMRIPPRNFYRDANAIVFVLNSTNTDVEYAVDELRRTLANEALAGLPLLILANNSALPDAMSAEHLEKAMNLSAVVGSTRSYCVQSLSGQQEKAELLKAMQWLKNCMDGKQESIPIATATKVTHDEVVTVAAQVVLPAAA